MRQMGQRARREAQRWQATSCAHGISTQLIALSMQTMHETHESIEVRPRPLKELTSAPERRSPRWPYRCSLALRRLSVWSVVRRSPQRRQCHTAIASSSMMRQSTTCAMVDDAEEGREQERQQWHAEEKNERKKKRMGMGVKRRTAPTATKVSEESRGHLHLAGTLMCHRRHSHWWV